jgi:hypothetical protein
LIVGKLHLQITGKAGLKDIHEGKVTWFSVVGM